MSLMIGANEDTIEINDYNYHITNFEFICLYDESRIEFSFDTTIKLELRNKIKHTFKIKDMFLFENATEEFLIDLDQLDEDRQKKLVLSTYSDEIRDYIESEILEELEEL